MQVDAPFFFKQLSADYFQGQPVGAEKYLVCYPNLIAILSSSFIGSKGEHEAVIPADHRATIQPLSQTGQIQEAVVLVVFLPQRVVGEKEVPYAWLEHTIWV